MGFISRQEAEDFLHKSENGTFLIRFSDSELGGVTVAWGTDVAAAWKAAKFIAGWKQADIGDVD